MNSNKLQSSIKISNILKPLMVLLITACSIDNNLGAEKACLAEPRGVIVENKTNLTIYTKVNNKWSSAKENLNEVQLVYEDKEKSLSLIRSGKYSQGTDWQTVPSLEILKIKVRIDEKIYEIEIDNISTKTNKITLIIHHINDSVQIEIKDYEKCSDLILFTN